jgi:methylated-DNA-[protein]-cysteine S-methyltransferase
MTLSTARMTTPIGELVLFAHAGRLCALAFGEDLEQTRHWLRRRFGEVAEGGEFPVEILAALDRYFAGDLAVIDAVPVDLGGTEFQQRVWAALRRIPAGRTMSYAELATAVGNPRAVRAVGLANGRNPVPLVVPCHRVIASDGTLCGYGGGLPRKQWLLRHEGAAVREPGQSKRQLNLPLAR